MEGSSEKRPQICTENNRLAEKVSHNETSEIRDRSVKGRTRRTGFNAVESRDMSTPNSIDISNYRVFARV